MTKNAVLFLLCCIVISCNTALCDIDSGIVDDYNFESLSGGTVPFVSLPSSKYLVMEGNSIEIKLDGKIFDDGFPLPENPSAPNPDDPNKLTWWWEVTSKPSEANEPFLESDDSNDIAGYTFVYDDPNRIITVDPNVKLFKPGYYEFRLYASDGEKTSYETIGISLYPPSQYGYREKGYLYLSPLPGAEYESSATEYILVRFVGVSPNDVNNLSTFMTVIGERSGYHPGTAKIASDKKTVIFKLDSTFASNELVTVSLNPIIEPNKYAVTIEPYEYQFMTTGAMAAMSEVQSKEDTSISLRSTSLGSLKLEAGSGPIIMPNGVSVPSNFPQISITINDNPDTGYIFLDNRTSGSNSYNVIFDNNGSPVWYLQTSDERRDMKVQRNGVLTMLARDGGQRFIGLDKHYRQIATYKAVNGASTDEHELVVLENGNYFLFGITNVNVELKKYFPDRSGTASISQTMIQEFTAEGDLIFQWKGLDHFKLSDADFEIGRFPHMNAIDIDDDGKILLSSRHISEVTKIDQDSGEIIWRLSGYNSDYTFVNDPLNGFRNQHSIRALGNRHYLLFDNGDLHDTPVSRSVEYELDPNKMTATIVWEFRETPDRYSHYMGNTQRLPNGNTLINWAIGSSPKLTEVRPDGTKAFEMNWVNGYEAYRVWRCQWDGMSLEPVLDIDQLSLDTVTLFFNKFGDPNVDYYKIYGGMESKPTTLWTTSDSTLANIDGFTNSGKYYFRVTAVDMNGTESGYSNEEIATIIAYGSGGEMVQNGDFSNGVSGWIWETSSASASWEIKDGVFHYIIDDGGPSISSVQLRQKGIPLIQGGHYIFELDVWADDGRNIEAKVGQEVYPWGNYSGIQYSWIDTEPKHLCFEFDMKDPTDMNSRVVINAGRENTDIDVYIDNVSLTYVPAK